MGKSWNIPGGRRRRSASPTCESLEGRRLLSGVSHSASAARAARLKADVQRYRRDLAIIQSGSHVDPAQMAALKQGLDASGRKVDALSKDAAHRLSAQVSASFADGIPGERRIARLKERAEAIVATLIDDQRDASIDGLDRSVDGLRSIYRSAGLTPENLQTIEADRRAIVADGGVAPKDPLVSRLENFRRRLLDLGPRSLKAPQLLSPGESASLTGPARAAADDASAAIKQTAAALSARLDAAFASGAPDDLGTAQLKRDIGAIVTWGFAREGADLKTMVSLELDHLAAIGAIHGTLRGGLGNAG